MDIWMYISIISWTQYFQLYLYYASKAITCLLIGLLNNRRNFVRQVRTRLYASVFSLLFSSSEEWLVALWKAAAVIINSNVR